MTPKLEGEVWRGVNSDGEVCAVVDYRGFLYAYHVLDRAQPMRTDIASARDIFRAYAMSLRERVAALEAKVATMTAAHESRRDSYPGDIGGAS